MNERFVEIFSDLAIYEDSINRPFPAKAYRNAVKLFKELDFEIDSAEQIKDLPGIGKGIFTKIDEFLKTGTFSKYEEYLQSDIAKCKELASIKGIGMNKARQLFILGITSLDILKDKVKNLNIGDPIIPGMNFTKAIKIGLDYEAHTDKTRMTLEQHDAVANPLLDAIQKNSHILQAEAVGSRRRYDGSANYTIGDIDIIIQIDSLNNIQKVKEFLEKTLDEVVMSGDTKVSGISKSRQVDYRIVTSCYEALRLHATGPMNFNIACRKIAISKGMLLNEYGLFEYDKNDHTKKTLISDKEKEILEKLDIGWIEPKDRKFFKVSYKEEA